MSVQVQIFPGIYFETVQPPLQDVLPRMDIASFVGFASAGPLHTPVVVESAQQFRDIFGADLSLAWDTERNQAERSYLGLSVETFFRNGGRRCWVVRIADEALAQTARFEIPGLIRSNGDRVESAYADARSPGCWAERVVASALLQVEQLQLIDTEASVVAQPALQLNASDWYVDVIANVTQVEVGDMISVNFQRDESLVYLYVEAMTAVDQGLRLSGSRGYLYVGDVSSSPAEFDSRLAISATDADYLLFKLEDLAALGVPDQWPQASPAADVPLVRLLRFELVTRGPEDRVQRLSNLGFNATLDRFWGFLPDDQNLYRQTDGLIVKKFSTETRAMLEEVTTPRFALAATEDAENWDYLPNRMDVLVTSARQSLAKFTTNVERLRREGIENFGSQIFVDQRLQNMRGDLLKQEANAIAFLSDSAEAQKLKGIHSLLLIDEATAIAVPDAVHRRWDALPPPHQAPLNAPVLEDIDATDVCDVYRIAWSGVSDSTSYTLEWSTDADFSDTNRISISGNALPRVGEPLDLMPEPQRDTLLMLTQDCPLTFYFRVRAEREGEVSTWSNHKARLIPDSDFLDCRYADAGALELELAVDSSSPSDVVASPAESGAQLLRWSFVPGETEAAVTFELQRASDRLFGQPETIFSGAAGETSPPDDADFFVAGSPDSDYYYRIQINPDSTYYYRVRAVRRGTYGPWSNTLVLWPSQLSQTTLQPVTDYANADLLAVHRALLRACYARGDLFGVLSLPRHYQVQDTLDHYALLKPGNTLDSIPASAQTGTLDDLSAAVPALTLAEESATTHAALYYPWLLTPEESNGQGRVDIRMIPPDGPIAGKIATRTIAQGAWIAPANSPLTDVLALTQPISDAQWARLSASRINVVRQATGGFVVLSANTLSTDSELGAINVRRLMSLLLRLTLREGNRYVFEPNNAVFQERVQQHFETVFARLYGRGAFAGRTASQAYRVVTDSSVNTIQSIEAGRFIVELHVAPSRALKFIRVRLMQSGPSQLQVQEV